MKLKNLLCMALMALAVFSCGKDDEPTSTPTPTPTNSAPEMDDQGFEVEENTSDFSRTVAATDSDGDDLTFEIVTDASDLFVISEGGDISLDEGKNLDFEAFGGDAPAYTLTVSVTDGTATVESQITITVLNVIENLFEDPDSFITTWEIPEDGFELRIGLEENLDYDFTIDWGDGTEEQLSELEEDNFSHMYATPNTYHVAIKGVFPSMNLRSANGVPESTKNAIVDVQQWGTNAWVSMRSMFVGGVNLEGFTATDTPNLTNTTSLASMFSGATFFNGDIGGWDVSNVTDMNQMFDRAEAFNQNIGGWDVTNVTQMSAMFFGATSFNEDIGGWIVSNVTQMSGMFFGATAFNQNIGGWDVSNVVNMTGMFESATDFNQNISEWNVSKVILFSGMFFDAEDFDQNLGDWTITSALDMANMFNNSGMSARNFSDTIIGWANLEAEDIPQDVFLGADGLESCQGDAALGNAITILSANGWEFQGTITAVECDQ